MKTLQNLQTAREVKSKVSHGSRGEMQDRPESEAPVAISGSVWISNADDQKVSHRDIELVQNLIERCLQFYMSREEVVKTLLNRARIDPKFTTLVWKKLEEENLEFFRAYYIRLKLKRQIILFNHLLEHQYHLMKCPMPPKGLVAAVQNGIHPVPVNNLPLGYPVLLKHLMPVSHQPHHNSMNSALSSCHVVNGVPATDNFHSIGINPKNEDVMASSATEVAAPLPSCNPASSISGMDVTPPSVASSGHFPFMPSEISGMDTSALDTAFASDVANSEGLVLGMDEAGCSKESLGSLGQIPWNFSLSDLCADLANLEDLDAVGNYTGSPFLPSDSDILLDSPEPDDMVEEYLADGIAGARPQLEEERL